MWILVGNTYETWLETVFYMVFLSLLLWLVGWLVGYLKVCVQCGRFAFKDTSVNSLNFGTPRKSRMTLFRKENQH